MPDVLDPVEAVPSPVRAKEIFVESQRITRSPDFAANISRAVIQNVWQRRSSKPYLDRDYIGSTIVTFLTYVEENWVTSDTATELTHNALTRRISKVLREAQTQGKIEDINAFIEGWLAAFTRPATESFINQAQHLDSRGQTDAALDIIFDQIDELLLAGEFTRVNELLAGVSPESLSVDLILGILTATLPAKRHLANRPRFFERVKDVLELRGQLKEGILVGLE